jgi:hypothetical protein
VSVEGQSKGELQVDSQFARLLGSHTPAELDLETGAVVGIWPDTRIALQNSAWRRFALQNAGADVLERWPLGACLLSGISGVMQAYYADAFARVLAQSEPWEQTYDCHSPNSRRQYQLRVLPLVGRGLLLIHSLLVEADIGLGSSFAGAKPYLGPDGLVRQCSNCRRTQRVGAASTWDWVPELVAHTAPRTSHGICSTCVNQYYPELQPSSAPLAGSAP